MKKYARSFSCQIGVREIINTRELAEEYRLSHWAQVLQERVESGLTIKAYCKQQGICGNTYFYWQRRVRAAAAAELGLCVCNEPVPLGPSFHEVRLVESTASPAATEVNAASQLCISVGEVRLTVDSTYPVEQLSQLLQRLSRPC